MPHKDRDAKLAYRREWQKRKYAEDEVFRSKHRLAVRKSETRRRDAVAEAIASFRANGCHFCGEKEDCCLVAHHKDPAEKSANVGDMVTGGSGVLAIAKELKKCVCLCMNCHAKVHAGKLSL